MPFHVIQPLSGAFGGMWSLLGYPFLFLPSKSVGRSKGNAFATSHENIPEIKPSSYAVYSVHKGFI